MEPQFDYRRRRFRHKLRPEIIGWRCTDCGQWFQTEPDDDDHCPFLVNGGDVRGRL